MSESEFSESEEKDPRHIDGQGRGFFGRPVTFVKQVVSELKRVVTPSYEDWKSYTIVVAVFVLIVVALVTVLDVGFGKLVEKVFGA